jgi:hypothetical protein
MPWKPRYTREQATEAISESDSWANALRRLGISPRGKNFATIRKWAAIWEIDSNHLPPYRPRRVAPRFSEAEARVAIAASRSWSEALRRLDYCPTGGNPRTLQKWAARWGISTSHFDSGAASTAGLRWRPRTPLEEILVQGSTYSRSSLKERLYEEGLKQPICELCGQGENWHGRRMSMILDHINGIRDDNRLENLRIVCPNCAATLDTHCGRKHPLRLEPRHCERCGAPFQPKYRDHRYCSRECGTRWDRRGIPRLGARRAARPPYGQLIDEIERLGYSAVGRKYGVSDNAIRKWVASYEDEIAARRRDSDLAEAA